MEGVKLAFAFKEEKLVDISQVENGLACGCICPECKQPLIAKNRGKINIHHFAHVSLNECKGGLETTIHLAAKDIFKKYKKIKLPSVTKFILGREKIIHRERDVFFDTVELEKGVGDIIPDISVKKGDRTLFIEISVTHPIDYEKRKKIKNLNISTLEIDLSFLRDYISLSELENSLINDVFNKKWIYNVKLEEWKSEQPYREIMYGVINYENPPFNNVVIPCPLNDIMMKTFVKIEKCFGCPFCLDIEGDKRIVKCLGHLKHEEPPDWDEEDDFPEYD